MNALVVLGTRPVVTALEAQGSDTVVCGAAQHRELVDQALAIFGLSPSHDLGVMEPESPTTVAARAYEAMRPQAEPFGDGRGGEHIAAALLERTL